MSEDSHRSCLICKLKNIPFKDQQKVENYQLHYSGERMTQAGVALKLCRVHGRVLFTLGQKRFIYQYYHLLKDMIDPKYDAIAEFVMDTIVENRSDYDKYVSENSSNKD